MLIVFKIFNLNPRIRCNVLPYTPHTLRTPYMSPHDGNPSHTDTPPTHIPHTPPTPSTHPHPHIKYQHTLNPYHVQYYTPRHPLYPRYWMPINYGPNKTSNISCSGYHIIIFVHALRIFFYKVMFKIT